MLASRGSFELIESHQHRQVTGVDLDIAPVQEKEIHTPRLDIQILQPLFSGVNAGTGAGLIKMDSKVS